MTTVAARAAPEWWMLPVAATLIVLTIGVTGFEPRALPAIYLAAVTGALSAIDVRERRLPNRLVMPGYAVAGVGVAGEWIVAGDVPLIALASGACYFVVLFALAAAGGMGMGDAKLAGVLGLAAGLVSPTAAIVAPAAAFLLGGVASVAALREGRATSIPFGPYLLAGFWIALLLS